MNRINGAEQAYGRHPAVGAGHMYMKVPLALENHSVRGSNKKQHRIEETHQ